MIRAAEVVNTADEAKVVSPAMLAKIADDNDVGTIIAGGMEYAVVRKPFEDRVTVYCAPCPEAVAP